MELWDKRHHDVRTYSGGMKRRLELARGLLHYPKVLFLDEPTIGLDPQTRNRLWEYILELKQREGTTIFLTTHYIEEAERLCRRVAFIVSGRIVREDTVASLMRQVEGRNTIELTVARATRETAAELAAAFPDTDVEMVSARQFRATSTQPLRVGELVIFLEQHGNAVSEAREARPSLEDVFVQVTGLAAQEMKREKERAGGGVAQ